MKKLYIKRSKIDGSGLFCNDSILKDELIGCINGPIKVLRNNNEVTKKKVENWIGAGRYSWIDTDNSIFKYINHSCEPNAVIRGKRSVYALEPITSETEITIDYSLTESEHDWKIPCYCKSKKCRGEISAIGLLPKSVYQKYSKYVSQNFRRIYEIDTKRIKLSAK